MILASQDTDCGQKTNPKAWFTAALHKQHTERKEYRRKENQELLNFHLFSEFLKIQTAVLLQGIFSLAVESL